MPQVADYALVAALGALVGLAELVSRYRDAPAGAVRTTPGVVYVLLNVAASAAALALVRVNSWTFGATGGSLRWTQVAVAGIGAMALFRTSLFTIRAGDRDIGVGPGSFLQIFRDAADRAVDRVRASDRSLRVDNLMTGVDYTKAREGLIPYCLALMQNVPDEDQQKMIHAVELLDNEPVEPGIKTRILGLHLMNVVGGDVLEAAVRALGDELK
ncbi:MAG: hypothetical protein IT159_10405 [Bryobacterales bacterium]|nr:hypothetical protein [Bryobacterales bacterium]